MIDKYNTIEIISEGLYKEKGSKFISYAFPVSSIDEVKEILDEYRKRFFDARHVCYAYKLGHERNEFRANDDGEPSGTAGKPILGQINSRELTNVLVIVIRYFGGILLGTGGLVSAYKLAASDALEQAKIIEKTIESKLFIAFDYILTNDVMRIIKEMNPTIINQKFESECSMIISIRNQHFEELKSKLSGVIGLKLREES